MKTNAVICFVLCVLLCILFIGCGEKVQSQNSDVSSDPAETMRDADIEEGEASNPQTDEEGVSDVSFDVVPQICNDIMEKLEERNWKNIAITHGSISTVQWGGLYLDTTYGAEESHIYTIMGDADKSVIKSDINIHAFSVVIYDDVLHDWVEEPIFYISDAGIVLDAHYWVQALEIDKEYISHEYLDSTEYLYADEQYLTYWMYSY